MPTFLLCEVSLSLGENFKGTEMKNLKLLLLAVAILSGGNLLAQEGDNRKVFEKQGNLLAATFYHENGEVAQKGFFKDGKLHGEWTAFDQHGNKTAMAKYDRGEKTGKWFFWNGAVLSEVDYQQNRIASVVHWRNKELVSQ